MKHPVPSRHWPRQVFIITGVLLIAIAVASCDAVGEPPDEGATTTTAEPPQETTSSTEPVDTTVPDTTVPATTVPDDDRPAEPEGDGDTPWWLLILAGGALIALIGSFVSRGSKQPPVVADTPRLTWKDHAKMGYAGARWAFDALTEDVAIWRGNAQFDGTTEVGATAGTTMAETWQQIGPRIDAARESLYALEATAPDPRTAEVARSVITTMLSVRSLLDARAEARYAYRSTERASEGSPTDLIEARDREIRASTNFNSARSDFAKALTQLASVA